MAILQICVTMVYAVGLWGDTYMNTMDLAAIVIHHLLQEAGIPISGVSVNEITQATRIEYLPEAAQEHKLLANDIVNDFWQDPQAIKTFNDNIRKEQAKKIISNLDPQSLFLKHFAKMIYQSLIEIRQKLSMPIRSWEQALRDLQDSIDKE